MKFLYHIAAAASLAMLSGCTNLDETLYDQVGSENYRSEERRVGKEC